MRKKTILTLMVIFATIIANAQKSARLNENELRINECANNILDTLKRSSNEFVKCYEMVNTIENHTSCLAQFSGSLTNLSLLLTKYITFQEKIEVEKKVNNEIVKPLKFSLANTFTAKEALEFQKKVDVQNALIKNEILLLSKGDSNFEVCYIQMREMLKYFSEFALKNN